jgi:hypothetical protein
VAWQGAVHGAVEGAEKLAERATDTITEGVGQANQGIETASLTSQVRPTPRLAENRGSGPCTHHVHVLCFV